MKLAAISLFGAIASVALSAPQPQPEPKNLDKVAEFLDLPDGVVKFAIQQKQRKSGLASLLGKREDKSAVLQNRQTAYYAEFEVGTPGQKVQGLLDTGSSDIWIYGSMSGVDPSYNANKSSSYKYVDSDFEIFYAQGTGAHGDYIKETLKYGKFEVKDQQIAEVVNPTQPEDAGIFGIGMIDDEVAKDKYPNLPQNMKDQGLIKHNAFSLFLDDLESNTGSILFGGIDDQKYKGDLETVKLSDDSRFEVPFEYEGNKFNALIDSGSTFMSLPKDIVEQIAKDTGAEYVSSEGAYFYDSMPSESIKFKVGDNKEIEIPPSELAVKSEWVGSKNGKPYVMPIIAGGGGSDTNIMGQSFLRSTYTVFDAGKKQIQIAQASYAKAQTNVFAMVGPKVDDKVNGILNKFTIKPSN